MEVLVGWSMNPALSALWGPENHSHLYFEDTTHCWITPDYIMFCSNFMHWSILQRKPLNSSQLIFHFISKKANQIIFPRKIYYERNNRAPTQGWIGFILRITLAWKARPSTDERKIIASTEHFRSVQQGWRCGWFSKFSPDVRAPSASCTITFKNHQGLPSVIFMTYTLDFWSFPLLGSSPTPQAYQQW